MPELPRALFFDLDDTIIDDSSNAGSAWQSAVAELSPAELDVARLLPLIQEVREWYWSDAERHRIGRANLRGTSAWIVAEALSRLGSPDEKLATKIGHRYRDLRDGARRLFPGAIETIESLRSQGVRLALLTNGSADAQRAKIKQFGLAALFDYVCIEGEFGCGKPDKRVYKGALQALSCQPAETWMVGDNLEWDVAAPMRLGITGIWIDRHATGLPISATSQLFEDGSRQPDRVINAITELL
jgi:putative hydrolase of the HAD superfamily